MTLRNHKNSNDILTLTMQFPNIVWCPRPGIFRLRPFPCDLLLANFRSASSARKTLDQDISFWIFGVASFAWEFSFDSFRPISIIMNIIIISIIISKQVTRHIQCNRQGLQEQPHDLKDKRAIPKAEEAKAVANKKWMGGGGRQLSSQT